MNRSDQLELKAIHEREGHLLRMNDAQASTIQQQRDEILILRERVAILEGELVAYKSEISAMRARSLELGSGD